MRITQDQTTEYDDLLRILQASPKIDDDIALENVGMQIKKLKVQQIIDKGIHPYAITHLKTGGMQTYVIDPVTSKRKAIQGRSEAAFYSALYEWYFGSRNRATIHSMFEEWLVDRTTYNVSPRTIKRYRDAYNKYIRNTVLDETPISRITPQLVTDFFNSLIREKKLTDKQYDNIVVIPNKLFKYAVYKEIISESPMERSMINTRACRHTHGNKTSDRVYYPEERKAFLSELQRRIDKEPRSDLYAIALLWKLGLRIGEIVAIKWTDIDWKARELHIQRMESRDENDKPCIVEHCKGNSPFADRRLQLSDYELELLKKIAELNQKRGYSDSGYVFLDGRGRRKSRAVDHWIRTICDSVGMPQKSAHDIRRTVASELYAHGESLESIRDLLGHSDIKTTAEYIIDTRGRAERGNRRQAILGENDLDLHHNNVSQNKNP